MNSSIVLLMRTSSGHIMFLVVALLVLSACNNKDKPAGQSMARVNGQDITVHQLNAELQRLGNTPGISRKEVLDGLIARQLLTDQAEKNKIDRDPKVMQSIARTKEQILAQSYLQTKISNIPKPLASEVEEFYQKNPQLFAQRKQFETKEITIDTKDLTPELSERMGTAKTLDEVQSWLDGHQIKYIPTQALRTSVELPPALVKAFSDMPSGSLFTIKQGEQSQLVLLQEVKSSPLTLDIARPKIEQYLTLQKTKEATEAEIARLRAEAKVEYLNESDKLDEKQASPVKVPKAAPATKDVERGLAGLK